MPMNGVEAPFECESHGSNFIEFIAVIMLNNVQLLQLPLYQCHRRILPVVVVIMVRQTLTMNTP
jgi:hypothetical protein